MGNMLDMIGQDRVEKGLYWTKALTLVEGCTPVSRGCLHCWSAAQTHMRKHQNNPKIKARYSGLTTNVGTFNGKIRLMHQSLELPLRTRKPTVWAVWNDLFHEDVPWSFIDEAIAVMRDCPQHIFTLLTKRAPTMAAYFAYQPAPKNVLPGVTVEDHKNLSDRIQFLLQVEAKVLWISNEPALGSLVLPPDFLERGNRAWVVCGGETGPGARPMNPEWARGVRDQCKEARVPYFHKHNGMWIPEMGFEGSDITGSPLPAYPFDPIADKKRVLVAQYTSDRMNTGGLLYMNRVTKKKAGRFLDGKIWNEIPEVKTK